MKDSVTLLFFSILLQAPFCNASNPTQQNIDRARRLERRTQVREQQMQQQADQQEREFARRALAGISDPADGQQQAENRERARLFSHIAENRECSGLFQCSGMQADNDLRSFSHINIRQMQISEDSNIDVSIVRCNDAAHRAQVVQHQEREAEMEQRMQEVRARNEAARLAEEQRRHQEREAQMERRMQEIRDRNNQQRQQQADQQEREFARRALAGISDPADDDRPENNADEAMYRRNNLRMHVMSRDPNFWEFPFVIQEFILDRIIAQIEAQVAREQAPIKKMDEVSKRSLQGRWLAWLQGKAFSTSNNPETACCICLEEGDAERALDYLPCDRLHPNLICLDCLSTVMANPHDDDAGLLPAL